MDEPKMIARMTADKERLRALHSPSQRLSMACVKMTCPIMNAIKRRGL